MITVLGSSGFIGSHLVIKLQEQGIDYYCPSRNEDLDGKDLGDVIYCIGMTADFRSKPFETVEAHIYKLQQILQRSAFTSFTYLSSTRVYFGSHADKGYVTEEDNLVLNTNQPNDLFAASKITGELLMLNSGRPNVKVVRVSNVFGNDFTSENFITSIVKDALTKQRIELRTTADSAKDYVSIEDVCTALILLADVKESGIYNLAAGFNICNRDIMDKLNQLTGAEIVYAKKLETIIFQQINISKLSARIAFTPHHSLLNELDRIVLNFKSKLNLL